MKKKDFIIIAAALVLAGVLFIVTAVIQRNSAGEVKVKADGEVIGTYSLDEDREVSIDTDYGHNLLIIKDGEAYMDEADCPDGYCTQQSAISKTGQTIVCLPHKLIVEAYSTEEDESVPDAISN